MTIIDFVILSRRGWRVLIAALLIGLAAGAAYTFVTPKTYTASANGFISTAGAAVIAGSDEAVQAAAAYLPLINSTQVRAEIAAAEKMDPTQLNGALTARLVESGSTMIEVTASADDPEAAARLANGALEALAKVVADVEEAGGSKTRALAVIPMGNASVPSSPSSPSIKLSVVVGAAVGIAGGYAFLLLRRALDVRVRTHTDMSELMGTGVLGRVPKLGKKGTALADSRVANIANESFRQIRTGLRFSNVDTEVRTVMITSANQGEGKSTVAASLAEVFAAAGQRTIIVDADMRRPKVARNFKVDGSVGLSGVLSGQVSVTNAVQATGDLNLFVLPAGAVPPNPSEMLGSVALKNLLAELSRDFFVIIDAPPVLPVTDASIISTMVDGVVYVTATGATRKAAVVAARAQLEQVGARVLGVVLNFVSLKDEGGYGYGYGYYRQNRSYYLTPEKPKEMKKKRMSREQPVGPIRRSPAATASGASEPAAMGSVPASKSEAAPLRRRSRA